MGNGFRGGGNLQARHSMDSATKFFQLIIPKRMGLWRMQYNHDLSPSPVYKPRVVVCRINEQFLLFYLPLLQCLKWGDVIQIPLGNALVVKGNPYFKLPVVCCLDLFGDGALHSD
jgi:hypothetical protein